MLFIYDGKSAQDRDETIFEHSFFGSMNATYLLARWGTWVIEKVKGGVYIWIPPFS